MHANTSRFIAIVEVTEEAIIARLRTIILTHKTAGRGIDATGLVAKTKEAVKIFRTFVHVRGNTTEDTSVIVGTAA
jgi:hypothetical protein